MVVKKQICNENFQDELKLRQDGNTRLQEVVLKLLWRSLPRERREEFRFRRNYACSFKREQYSVGLDF